MNAITNKLINQMETNDIQMCCGALPNCKSVSIVKNKHYYIAIDMFSIQSIAEMNVVLSHEIGHCMTGSFYNIYSNVDIRGRHEYRADKWAAHNVMPPNEIKTAMQSGLTETWQLAEHFNVTNDFIDRVIYIYRCEELIA